MALHDNSMTSSMVSKKTMEVNPEISIMTEIKRKAAVDKSDKTVQDLIWLLFRDEGRFRAFDQVTFKKARK